MPDRLRPLWDFDDLEASEGRLRTALTDETTDEGRAEVLTQLARVEGLRERFEEGDALLDEAASLGGSSAVVAVRLDLERGRLRRSSGDAQAALPLFERAYEGATALGDEFLAVDAVHMVAIAASDFDTRLAWTRRGIELAEASGDPTVTYWLGSLFNNVGWDYFDAGDYETALDWFERALTEREKRPDESQRIEHAREAVAEARRMIDEAAGD